MTVSNNLNLRPYQREAVDKLLRLDGCGGLWLAMGTGKTRTALTIAQELGCRRVLVVTPPPPATRIWSTEVESCWPGALCTQAAYGSVVDRAEMMRMVARQHNPQIVIVTYYSYWRDRLRKAILYYRPDMLILDEAHRCIHRGAKQTRFAHTLANYVPHRLGLSGTPAPNGLQDYFSIYKALRPSLFGTRYADFESRYIRRGGYLGYQIVGYQNEDELQEKVAATSYRVAKDVLGLLPPTDVSLQVPLVDTTVYERIRKKALADVRGMLNGQHASGTAIARTALVNVLRLQQITSGFVKVEDGNEIELSTEKLDALSELLADAVLQADHVVVFCRFRHDIIAAAKRASKVAKTFTLWGDTPQGDRDGLLEAFRREPRAVLVANIAVASVSIDLTCASVAIFFSLDYSLTNYQQARDRIHRHGQTRHVTYYHLIADVLGRTASIDEKVLRTLARKEDLSRRILDPVDLFD